MEKIAFLKKTLDVNFLKSDFFPFSRCFTYLFVVLLFDVEVFDTLAFPEALGAAQGCVLRKQEPCSCPQLLTLAGPPSPEAPLHLRDPSLGPCVPAPDPPCATSSAHLSPC